MLDAGWFQVLSLALAVLAALTVGRHECRQAIDLFDHVLAVVVAVGAFLLVAMLWWAAALFAGMAAPFVIAGYALYRIAGTAPRHNKRREPPAAPGTPSTGAAGVDDNPPGAVACTVTRTQPT